MTPHAHPLLPARRCPVSPVLVVAVLAVTGLGCLTAAVVELVATAGPVLLAAAAAVLFAALVKAITAAAGALPWLGCLALAVAVSPLAGLFGLAWLLTRRPGGEPDA